MEKSWRIRAIERKEVNQILPPRWGQKYLLSPIGGDSS